MPGPHGFTVRASAFAKASADKARRKLLAKTETTSLVLHASIAHEVHLALRSPACAMLSRPPHPIPTFVTMANAPPRDRTAGLLVLICPTAKANYFCKGDWTG